MVSSFVTSQRSQKAHPCLSPPRSHGQGYWVVKTVVLQLQLTFLLCLLPAFQLPKGSPAQESPMSDSGQLLPVP